MHAKIRNITDDSQILMTKLKLKEMIFIFVGFIAVLRPAIHPKTQHKAL